MHHILLALFLTHAEANSPIGPAVVQAMPADLTEPVPPNVVPLAWYLGVSLGEPVRVSDDGSTYSGLLHLWRADGQLVPVEVVYEGGVVAYHPHESLEEGTYLLAWSQPDLPVMFDTGEAGDTATWGMGTEGNRFLVAGPPDHIPPAPPEVRSVIWYGRRAESTAVRELRLLAGWFSKSWRAKDQPAWTIDFQWRRPQEPTSYVVTRLGSDGRPVGEPFRSLGHGPGVLLDDPEASPEDTTFEVRAVDLAGNQSEPVRVGPLDGVYRVDAPGCSHVAGTGSVLGLWLPLLGLGALRRRRATCEGGHTET